MQGAYDDLTGRRYGDWHVLRRVPGRTLSGKVRWLCRCACGRTIPVLAFTLKNGGSTKCKSCGARQRTTTRKRKTT